VEKYKCGKLVEAGEVDELRVALADIAHDKSWRRLARTNSLRAALDAYSYESYADRITAAYRELM
jgi:glycosyltransferase involved in cell wall biosynthesis